jgi:hypothetical protein
LRLSAISPNVVPLHGGDVRLTVTGKLSSGQSFRVNGAPATHDGDVLHVPPSEYIGSLSITVGQDPDHPEASLECAGRYEESADSVALSETNVELHIPLHPELAHDCARFGYVEITNDGDAPFVIYPEMSGSPGFAPFFPPDECPLPMFHDSCEIQMCFSSNVSMVHAAHLVVPSTITTASLDFTATVLPATPGLDVAMWRPYTTLAREQVRGVTALPDGGFAVWDESPAIMFETVTRGGVSTWHWMGTIATVTSPAFRTIRSGGPGQGIYALVGNVASDGPHHALIHFDSTGERDLAFAEVALAGDSYFPASAIHVSSQRVLVIGNATVTALTASGARDATWGDHGVLDFSALGTFTNASELDDTGRLYVVTTAGVVRIGAGGTIDPDFHHAGSVTALTLSAGSPIIADGGTVARLDHRGTATTLPLSPMPRPASSIVDLAIDRAGQLNLITDDGQLVRFTASGQLDGIRGFDGAHRLACPPSGDCAIVGLANGLDKYLIALTP